MPIRCLIPHSNAVLEKSFGAPTVTKDGVSVAKEVDLEDGLENVGAQMVREVASNTCVEAADGTMTAKATTPRPVTTAT